MSSQPNPLASAPARVLAARRPTAASRWIDARLNDAALAMVAFSRSLRRRRSFVCLEQADGTFKCEAPGTRAAAAFVFQDNGFPGGPNWRGRDVVFRLTPQRFVLRELELPARAAEFLEGVVRAQIDRITPWRPNEAAFGWSAPEARDGQKIAVWVAAAKRAPIVELAEAAVISGADAVTVTTTRPGDVSPLQIFERRAGAALRNGRWRFALLASLFAAMAVGVIAMTAQLFIGADIASRSEALRANIAQGRATLLRREHAGDNPAAQALQKRKRTAVSAVIALEALSRALPDEAYLTDMRLEGDKLDIGGVAANAADLIHALEKSPHFSHATFTAPTVRAAQDKGETFRIETRVAPLLTVAP